MVSFSGFFSEDSPEFQDTTFLMSHDIIGYCKWAMLPIALSVNVRYEYCPCPVREASDVCKCTEMILRKSEGLTLRGMFCCSSRGIFPIVQEYHLQLAHPRLNLQGHSF